MDINSKSFQEQYDVSSEMKRLFDIKQKQRTEAKQYYQNFLYNPHRPVNDGVPFDPALQRFSAMSAYHAENYRPKGKQMAVMLAYIVPIGFVFWSLTNTKKKEEALYRSGQVSYSDRRMKMIF